MEVQGENLGQCFINCNRNLLHACLFLFTLLNLIFSVNNQVIFCFMSVFQVTLNNTFWCCVLSNSLNQDAQSGLVVVNEGDSRKRNYDLESVLSLDDGRWSSIPVEESDTFAASVVQEDFAHLNIKQPSPPPVLAQVESRVISPSKVADPRPGPAKSSHDGTKTFQNLHVVSSLPFTFSVTHKILKNLTLLSNL